MKKFILFLLAVLLTSCSFQSTQFEVIDNPYTPTELLAIQQVAANDPEMLAEWGIVTQETVEYLIKSNPELSMFEPDSYISYSDKTFEEVCNDVNATVKNMRIQSQLVTPTKEGLHITTCIISDSIVDLYYYFDLIYDDSRDICTSFRTGVGTDVR